VFKGHLYLFVKGALDTKIYVNSTADAVTWTGWSQHASGGLTNTPLAAAVYLSRLYVFAKSLDSKIYLASTADGTTWTAWTEVPIGGVSDASPVAVVFANRLYLFAKGILGPGIFINSTDGLTWTSWSDSPSGGMTNVPLAAAVFPNVTPATVALPGTLNLIAKGLDSKIYISSTVDATTWTPWTEVAGGGFTNESAAAVVFSGRLYLFVRGILDLLIYANVGIPG
jgi:hypothetical protein